MKSFYKVILISLVGLIIGIFSIYFSNRSAPLQTQPILKTEPPYESYAYGAGVIELESTNIPIGTAIQGIVTKLYIKVGQKIKVGDALFTIDDRDVRAKITVAEVKVKVADAALKKVMHQFQIYKELKEAAPQVVSKKQYLSQLDELNLATANLELAKTEVMAFKKELEMHTISSLIDGQVLRCKMQIGEYIDNGQVASPLILLGSNAMRLPVEINENDVWRIKPKAKAVAFVRGHPELKIPLNYNYTEPYISSKTAFTDLSTERTDMRVLQMIYTFEKPDFPVYVGQQLDVFIEAHDNTQEN
ncbi:efflux RND transporter periplasmic adaptor subunit [Thiomicrorhabdus arctica]|uniref:efflux RND transporter periplasmic adaptor subunit n=1 Tax=Thiomicrorhabdus arctica TaxID=131540 RepID=UPI0003745B7D|nr:biotin/lipoyl-binding protein [Thiomicrorhabdus arctica]